MVQWWGHKRLLLCRRIMIKVDWPATVFHKPLPSLTHPFTSPCLNCRPCSCLLAQVFCAASSEPLIGPVPVFCRKFAAHRVLADSLWEGGSSGKLICSFWNRFCISAPMCRFSCAVTVELANRHRGAWFVQHRLMSVSQCFGQEGRNINASRKARNFCCAESVRYFQRCCSFSESTSVFFSLAANLGLVASITKLSIASLLPRCLKMFTKIPCNNLLLTFKYEAKYINERERRSGWSLGKEKWGVLVKLGEVMDAVDRRRKQQNKRFGSCCEAVDRTDQYHLGRISGLLLWLARSCGS